MSSTPSLNFFEIHTKTLGASALFSANAPHLSSTLLRHCCSQLPYIMERAIWNKMHFYLILIFIICHLPPLGNGYCLARWWKADRKVLTSSLASNDL